MEGSQMEKKQEKKKVVYVDMDGVLVDFQSAFPRLDPGLLEKYKSNPDDIPGIFPLMDPMPGAVESFKELAQLFDTYILSTAPWDNPTAWTDKLLWVRKYLGEPAYKRLILSHHKHLNRGDYLIDDRTKHGADEFSGEHIHFGQPAYPDWPAVMTYLQRQVVKAH
jgi:5'-nucleotidase